MSCDHVFARATDGTCVLCDDAAPNHRGAGGKWSTPGVPHTGWQYISGPHAITDLGEDRQVCAMCETSEIRHVHALQHAKYRGVIHVGCVCAGHMTGDADGAVRRERLFVNRARRRQTWLKRPWRVGTNSNHTLMISGVRVTVYVKYIANTAGAGDWGAEPCWFYVIATYYRDPEFSVLSYAKAEDAKLAVFDVLYPERAS